jgi:hypothetical protein
LSQTILSAEAGVDPVARVLAIACGVIAALALLLNVLNYARQRKVDKRNEAAEQRRAAADALAGAAVKLEVELWSPELGARSHSISQNYRPDEHMTIGMPPPGSMQLAVLAVNEGRAAVEVRDVRLEQVDDPGNITGWSGGFIYGPALPTVLPGLHSERWGIDRFNIDLALEAQHQIVHHGLRFTMELGNGSATDRSCTAGTSHFRTASSQARNRTGFSSCSGSAAATLGSRQACPPAAMCSCSRAMRGLDDAPA